MRYSNAGIHRSWLTLLLVVLGLLAVSVAPHARASARLNATLLPPSGAQQPAQLALSWRGPADARFDVKAVAADGSMRVVLAERPVRSGMNLIALSSAPVPGEFVRVDVHDAVGTVVDTWDSAAAPDAAGFAWQPTFFGPGVDNNVLSTTVWDDGSGPALYVGGLFLTAGGRTVNRIARWDGNQWSALGSGVNGSVFALAVYDGTLIAAGAFTEAGGVSANNIARWDGSQWSRLGSGTSGSIGTVNGLAVYQGALIAVGGFTEAGGVNARGVASWDGDAWSPLGLGVDSGTATAATVFAGDLIVSGNFIRIGGININRIARWNGSVWAPLGAGVSGSAQTTVYAMEVYGGALIAGGNFSQAGSVTANRIARWDGSTWSALGSGTSSGTVYALDVFGDDLIAGGAFTSAGGITTNNIARWNGSVWSALSATAGTGTDNQVRAVCAFDGALFAGGVFAQAGGIAENRIARWDGSGWSTLAGDSGSGVNGQVFASTVYDGDLIIGGDFTQVGNVAANRVARWDGTAWSALGSGLAGGSLPLVDALIVHDGALIAGGSFTTAGGITANNVARWDGGTWSVFTGAAGTGTNDRVWALGEFNDALIVGGQFARAGGLTVNNIARWDGSEWSTLAGASGIGANNRVIALTGFNGTLIAAGNFTQAGGVTVNFVAGWNGSEWSPLSGPSGIGVDNRPAALTVFDNALIVGGGFASAGGVPVNNIARWDGTAWSALAGGLSEGCCAPWVRSLTVYDGSLIAGGIFTAADGVTVNGIARWDGSSWSALPGPSGTGMGGSSVTAGGTFNTSVATLAVLDPDGSGPIPEKLVAGGSFSISGGVPNWGVAYYGLLALTATPDPLDFGSVVIGETRGPSSITMTNHGAAAVTISALSDPGVPFANAGGSCGATPIVLAPGASCTLDYAFTSPSEGAFAATITIGSDAASGARTITLQGRGSSAALNITPDPVDFGTLITGETGGPMMATLTNAAATPINVSAIGAAMPPFAAAGGTCSAAPFTLAPSASCTLAYTFSPIAGGDFSDSVVVTSDASSSPNPFTLKGAARLRALTITPDPLAFGDVAIGATSEPLSLDLINSGTVDVTVTELTAVSAPFAAAGGTCAAAPFVLAAGDSCSVAYTFSPLDPGTATTTVTIASNAPSSPDTVLVEGNGTGAALSIDPQSLAVTVGQGHTSAQPLRIGNPGNETLTWQVTQNPEADGLLLRPLGPATIPTTVGSPAANASGLSLADVDGVFQTTESFVAPAGATTITQSNSFVIQSPSTIGCQPPGFGQPPFPTARTSFYRVFRLSDFGINGQFDVSAVTFGIEQLTANIDLSIRLSTLSGALSAANLTEVGSATQTFTPQVLQLITVPVTGTIPPGATLVVEIAAPALTGNGVFLPGSNNLGQTAPSYVNSFGQCGISDITDYADLDQPNIALVVSVTGTPLSCELPSWIDVAPVSGSVEGGASEDVQVTFDASGLTAGDFSANLCLASNDPIRPLAIVPLSMSVVVLDTFTVTPSAGPGGSITPDTPQSVDEGFTTTFTLTADAGYHVEAVGGTCGGTLVGDLYTTASINADCSVEASFAVDAATAIAVVSGTPQSTVVDSAFGDPLVVRVTNGAGLGAPGVTVSFTVPAQGASAVLPATATTDANGEVSVPLSANTVAGSYTVSASVAGVAADADFALTNEAGPVSRVSAIQGTLQSTAVLTVFPLPLTAQALDAWNNPVAGATITFTAPADGASATLSATAPLTDANGIVSVAATANAQTGSYVISAASAGQTIPAEFALTNTAPMVNLGISIDDREDYARPGEVLNYLVVVSNAGADTARDVDVAAVLPQQIDAAQASWVCLANSGCTPGGDGALADTGVSVPGNGSVSYLMSAPVRSDASGDTVTTTADANSADDAQGATASDNDTLVLFRDGFDGPGSAADVTGMRLLEEPFDIGDVLRVVLPAEAGTNLIDTLLVAVAGDRSGFRIERLNRGANPVRLVVIDSGGSERARQWHAIPAEAHGLTLRLLDTGSGTYGVKLDGVDEVLDLARARGAASYRVQTADPGG